MYKFRENIFKGPWRISVTLSRTAFIVNPHAGNGSAGSKWPKIRALAKDRLGSFKSYITENAGDAKQFTKKAITDGVRRVVCVGGDGTLNEVVNGIMAHDESVRSGLKLGFVPYTRSDRSASARIIFGPIPRILINSS